MIELAQIILISVTATAAFVTCIQKIIVNTCNTEEEMEENFTPKKPKVNSMLLPENTIEEDDPPCYNDAIK
jgi:hypothetical protein